jgi:hypothetical protein
MPRFRNRQGFALPVALASMVVIAVLIAGVYYTSGQSARSARDITSSEQAFRVAEQGLVRASVHFDTVFANAATVGQTSGPITYTPTVANATNTVRITKLTATSWLIASTATVGLGTAKATGTTAQIFKSQVPSFNFLGALSSNGPTKIGGSSLINGNDTSPTGWSCPPNSAPMPGLAMGPGDSLDISGCTSGNCLIGSPALSRTTAANDTTKYFVFGDLTWKQLTTLATKRYTGNVTMSRIQPNPEVVGSPCVISDVQASFNWNWGDIRSNFPCSNYFPILYFEGGTATVKLSGGTGQGIMLIEGDLEISGGFEFYGPVIVRGRLRTTGAGGKLNGGVMAANVDLEQNTVLGDAIITYSNCAISTAIAGAFAGRILPASQRSWVELH